MKTPTCKNEFTSEYRIDWLRACTMRHSEAGRGDSKWAKYPRQDQTDNNISVSTTLFHSRQTRKEAQCAKYRNLAACGFRRLSSYDSCWYRCVVCEIRELLTIMGKKVTQSHNALKGWKMVQSTRKMQRNCPYEAFVGQQNKETLVFLHL